MSKISMMAFAVTIATAGQSLATGLYSQALVNGPAGLSVDPLFASTANGQSVVTLGPLAKVTTTSTTHGFYDAYSNTELRYYVSFTAPSQNYAFQDGYHDVFVPLTINYAGGIGGAGNGIIPIWSASAQILVQGDTPSGYSNVVQVTHACNQLIPGACGAFGGQVNYEARAFSYFKSTFNGLPYVNVYPAEIRVDLTVGADAFYNSTANAFADPQFIIDDLNAPVQLTFSPGVGNAAPVVPEPATWLYLIAGIAGGGALMRRRRDVAGHPAVYG